jgi:hypothetical protein
MHDWTLETISIAWKEGVATFTLKGPEKRVKLTAHGVQKISVPRSFDWGPSISVNKTEGPTLADDGLLCFLLEMQSGDTIEIVAAAFDVPDPQPWNQSDTDGR